jgi:DNA-binding NtrC family response regulator
VERGLFREDLFRRLNVVRIELPPLRQRRNDIPLLAHHFLEEANREFGRAVGGFTRRAMERLMQYHWPGNVRELKNLVFAIVRTKDRGLIDLDALPPEIRSAAPPLADIHLRVGMTLKEVERIVIQETLARHGWNRVETARVLGIGLRTLYRKIKEYGLRPGEEGSSRR